ncbi:MAG TPA: class I SAM-dependent methyltransferase [Caulobacteraceae bacterium]|nr:class I SAM-dependent methyltransferase [Caulobacteraceae bacterium]
MAATNQIERDEFARRQAQMTAAWMSNLVAGNDDYLAYIEGRKAAYAGRWIEALRFVRDGDKLLDIGGGNLWLELLQLIQGRGVNYWYLDVDPECVAGCKSLAQGVGLDPARFEVGFNDRLPYPDGVFDAVFSSHCIEHSFDLSTTFEEIWRILRPGGVLLMAVPLGWEANPEHPYFLTHDDWVALAEDSGFEIRVAQVGREYPELGYDLFIAARKGGSSGEPRRIDPNLRRKTSFDFVPFTDRRVSFTPEPEVRGEHALSFGAGWRISIEPPPGATSVLPIFAHHPWSGIVEVRCGEAVTYTDLYAWFSFAQPTLLELPEGRAPGEPVVIRAVGRNPASHGEQCAIYGVMFG